jgi:hypothetical protein
MALKRDYENIQNSYNSLLNRKLEAEIAVNMEKKQKGEQFRIIDQARLPQKPVSPDLMKLFILSVAAGLGLGAGLIFLLDFLDTSFRTPEDLESDFGIPVLAAIPTVHHQRGKLVKKLNFLFILVSVTVATGLFIVFAFLVFNGTEPIVEFVQDHIKFPIKDFSLNQFG